MITVIAAGAGDRVSAGDDESADPGDGGANDHGLGIGEQRLDQTAAHLRRKRVWRGARKAAEHAKGTRMVGSVTSITEALTTSAYCTTRGTDARAHGSGASKVLSTFGRPDGEQRARPGQGMENGIRRRSPDPACRPLGIRFGAADDRGLRAMGRVRGLSRRAGGSRHRPRNGGSARAACARSRSTRFLDWSAMVGRCADLARNSTLSPPIGAPPVSAAPSARLIRQIVHGRPAPPSNWRLIARGSIACARRPRIGCLTPMPR